MRFIFSTARFATYAFFLSAASTLGATEIAAAALTGLKCFSASVIATKLPDNMEVGVETVHRDPQRIITLFVPIPAKRREGKMASMNSMRVGQALPQRFVVGDGTVITSFIGVDRRPGTRLDVCASEIISHIPKGADNSRSRAAVLEFLQYRLGDYLAGSNEGKSFHWESGLAVSHELSELFAQAKDLPVGHFPLKSGEPHAVSPLETFLENGSGVCIHKSLLASVILSKLGISHRVVMGGSNETGHTWIELADGRILDPTWNILGRPTTENMNPGWFRHGTTPMFRDQTFPYVILR